MRPGAMGDLLMCTAVLPALKARGYFVRFVAHPKFAEVLDNHPLIDELVTLKEGTRQTMIDATSHLAPADKYIYLYYPYYAKRDLPGHAIPIHLAHHYCNTVDVPVSDQLSIHLSEEQETWGKQHVDKILIHTTTMWSPYKNWPIDRWQALADRIEAELGIPVYQIGIDKDTQLAGDRLLPSPSIQHAIAALKHCRLFIGLDSVFNHASRAVNKPSIILWGSTHPHALGYRQNLNLVNGIVWQPIMGNDGPSLTCQPCYREYSGPGNNNNQRTCPYTQPYPIHALPEKMHANKELNACMASQSVDMVFHHVTQMLDNPAYVGSHQLPPCN